MNDSLFSVLIIIVCLLPYVFFHWWLRKRFVVDGYTCSGSYKQKHSKYKKQWSPLQRGLLIPLFSAKSTRKYHALGGLSYCHFLITVITIAGFLLCEQSGYGEIHWQIGLCGIGVICVVQMFLILS